MTPVLSRGCVIAVLGAGSTDKTELARAPVDRLTQRGIVATRVSEYLREWCDREGRVPRRDEQAAIAAEQTRRIADAAARGVAVADTTALMTAICSDLLFGDEALYADAVAAHRGYALTLLTALDLPWVADGLQRGGPHVREPVDALVRAALDSAGLPYSVVHGAHGQRLANAWNALNTAARSEAAQPWRGSCEKCSDPVCEHLLFTELLARRP